TRTPAALLRIYRDARADFHHFTSLSCRMKFSTQRIVALALVRLREVIPPIRYGEVAVRFGRQFDPVPLVVSFVRIGDELLVDVVQLAGLDGVVQLPYVLDAR